MSPTDQDLLERWIERRDAEAFREISVRHAAMVFSTSRRILRDPSKAEDVAQECFQRLAFKLKDPSALLAAWLHRVATNLSLKLIRSEKRRSAREERFAMERSAGNGEGDVSWDALQEHVDDALAELPDALRLPLVLHFIENRTHAAIARDLGVSRGTVTYRVRRGVERIRKTLRRRGVFAGAGVLASLMSEHMVSEAAPRSLTAAIGRLAIAGTGTGSAAGTVTTSWTVLGGTVLMKKALAAIVAIAVAALLWRTTVDEPPLREERADVAPRAGRAAAPVETVDQTPPAADVEDFAEVADPVAAAARGAIGGRVYDAVTGKAIAGAGVGLYPEGKGFKDSIWTKSDREGVFRFTQVTAGQYRVERWRGDKGLPRFSVAERKTVTLLENEVVEDIDFPIDMGLRVSGIVVDVRGKPVAGATVEARDRDRARRQSSRSGEDGRFELAGFQQTRTLTLEAEHVNSGLASDFFGLASLGPEGLSDLTITLRPTGSVSGHVVDLEGRPLAGVRVSVWPKAPVQRMMGAGSATTREDGAFEVEGIAGGVVEPRVLLLDGDNVYKVPRPPYDAVELAWGGRVAGATLVIDAARGLTVSGRIADEKGAPVEGALVEFLGPARHSGIDCYSDKDGYYKALRFPPGAYTARVSHADHAETLRAGIRAGATGVDIVMMPCGVIAGVVVDAGTGEPLTTFELYHLDEFTRYRGGAERKYRQYRDERGRFRIGNIEPGPVTVVVRAEGYGESRIEFPDVKSGETIDAVEIALGPPARIEGIVVDAVGRPVASAGVVAGELPRNESPEVTGAVRTGPDGSFVLTDLPVALGVISAFHLDYASTTKKVDLKPGAATVVRISLPRGGTVEGTLFHGGRPWPNQSVRLYTAGERRLMTESDASGRYRFDHVDLGEAEVLSIGWLTFEKRVHGVGGRWLRRPVLVEDETTATVDLHFAPATSSIEGRVLDGGAPLAAASIKLYIPGNEAHEMRHGRIAQDGSYRFEYVPEGAAILMVTTRDRRWRRLEVEVGREESLRRDVDVTAGSTIEGRVRGLPGVAITVLAYRGAVTIDSRDAHRSLKEHYVALAAKGGADDYGRFILPSLDAGAYTVVAATVDPFPGERRDPPESVRFVSRAVTVDEDSTQELELEFGPE